MPVTMFRLPEVDLLRRTFSYDPESGEVRYLRELPHLQRTIQTKWGGRIAGVKQDGRRSLSLTYEGVHYRMSSYRVAWALYYGADPYPFEIDHIDGDPSNDRLANLRIATRSENMRNVRTDLNKKTTTGVRGVRFYRRGYEASITTQGTTLYLGRFKTLADAEAAYKRAANELHGSFARHLSSQMGG